MPKLYFAKKNKNNKKKKISWWEHLFRIVSSITMKKQEKIQSKVFSDHYEQSLITVQLFKLIYKIENIWWCDVLKLAINELHKPHLISTRESKVPVYVGSNFWLYVLILIPQNFCLIFHPNFFSSSNIIVWPQTNRVQLSVAISSSLKPTINKSCDWNNSLFYHHKTPTSWPVKTIISSRVGTPPFLREPPLSEAS